MNTYGCSSLERFLSCTSHYLGQGFLCFFKPHQAMILTTSAFGLSRHLHLLLFFFLFFFFLFSASLKKICILGLAKSHCASIAGKINCQKSDKQLAFEKMGNCEFKGAKINIYHMKYILQLKHNNSSHLQNVKLTKLLFKSFSYCYYNYW